MTVGMEAMMNDPRTSPFTEQGSKGFREVFSASGLPTHEVLKHLGSKKKTPKVKEQDKSEKRLSALEAESQPQE